MDSIPHQKASTAGDHPGKHHKPSSSELLSSAKLVAEAAKATLHHESDKVDKARVADAAADLLGAASHYGKLEEKSFGKYVDKAENYLHHYHSSHSSSTTTSASASAAHSAPHSGGDHGHSGSDYGEYFKMAQGFLKKH